MGADLDALRARVEVLEDRLRNGIKFDEGLNVFVVVWTQKEIDEAKAEAAQIMTHFAVGKSA